VLWRSGQHLSATPGDLARFAALGVTTVIDLRGDIERERYPCARPEGFAAAVIHVPGETSGEGGAPHVAAAAMTADAARERMTRLYSRKPFHPVFVLVMRRYLAALAQRDGPSLVHCLAGKDRTGMAVAVLHSLLGVHHDDIMADYMLTNTAGRSEARIAAGAATIRANYGEIDEAAIRVLMSVEEGFLDATFASIADEHGDAGTYARAVLGVTPAMESALAARLIA